jgi:hypothetical protein
LSDCKTVETTNTRLACVCSDIRELICWAEADAEHARENDAPDTARDDTRRARNLERALKLLQECKR